MNLLITDDEPLIHVSIEYSLKELGDPTLQVFHAANGAEMLRVMEEQDIDIALVDIRMPGMDGLTAIDTARKRWDKTHYYIMSGFSEFEYAREAVRLQVTDYLLKPLSSEQLSAILEQVRQEKDREAEQIREAMHAWLAGTLHKHDVSALYAQSCFSAVLLCCCDSPREELRNRLPKVPENAGPGLVTIPCREGQLMLLYGRDRDRVKAVLRGLSAEKLPEDLTCFATQVSEDPGVLGKDMHRILDLFPIRVFRGTGQLWKLKQLSGTPDEDAARANEWIELRGCLQEKRHADFVAKSAGLIPSLSSMPPAELRHLSAFLRIITARELPENAGPEAVAAFLKDTGEKLIIRETAQDRIDAVIEYVQENFCEDISIAKLSMEFELSPNYLGALFRKKLGVSFVDYLTSLRIARAKELLASDTLSVREIGESVGYYSQSYFNKIFIRKEGCTPGEYRRARGADSARSVKSEG